VPARRWRSKAAAAICLLADADDAEEAILRVVDNLLDEAGFSQPPVDVELLASLRRVRRVDLVEIAEAGRLIPEGLGYAVQVNLRHTETKRRFTICHEVGHTFFDDASRLMRFQADSATGLFDLRDEEEYLCDLAAAWTLLNPRWVTALIASRPPSLTGLFELAETCKASIEATAIQISRLGLWRCSFVFWEPGLRKTERLLARQSTLPGWEAAAMPKEKLRVRRVYGPAGAPYLPKNKSIGEDTGVWRAYAEQTTTEGQEQLDLGTGVVPALMQSAYAPYHDEAGVLRPRVITCVIWPPKGKERRL